MCFIVALMSSIVTARVSFSSVAVMWEVLDVAGGHLGEEREPWMDNPAWKLKPCFLDPVAKLLFAKLDGTRCAC